MSRLRAELDETCVPLSELRRVPLPSPVPSPSPGRADAFSPSIPHVGPGAPAGEAEKRAELCERRLIELNHRVANTLQIVSGLVRAQRGRLADPLAKEALGATVARLEAIGRLHRHLCHHAAVDRVDLGRFIAEIAPAMEESTGLRCELDVEPVELPSEVALQLVIAANELVFNARKHAYGGQEGGLVRVSCRRDPDGRRRLSVADKGHGLPGGFDYRHCTGLGMRIIESTVLQFGGELQAENDQGARFTMLLMLA